MSEELKPCPKCNSNTIDYLRDESGMWYLKCFHCNYVSIACLSMRQVTEAWNRRAGE